MLLGVHSGVHRVDVRIEKPGALEGRARAASVEVRRARKDYPVSALSGEQAGCDVLLETREARLELVRIAPERVAPVEPGFAARALAWVVEGEVDTERGRLEPSLPSGVIHSSSEAPALLRNPGPDPACLFRCWKRIL